MNKFYYLRGGAERSFFETQRLLEKGGHEVIPFAMVDDRNRPSPYQAFFVDHIEFNTDHSLRQRLEIVPRVIYYREARRKLERLLSREPVDMAHLHNIAHQISPSIVHSLRKFDIPVVQTLHDYKLICPTYTMLAKGHVCQRCVGGHFYHAALQRCNKGSLSASLLNVVETYTHRALGLYRDGIDLFIAPSRFLHQKLQEDGRRRSRVMYLPNAIDAQRYRPQYGGSRYCVYLGRLSPEKGVHTLIRAMRALPDLQLRIVGEGLQRPQLEAMVHREGLKNVNFCGSLYDDDLQKVLSQALFVVLPSECYENCPFAVLEAFAMGKPVLGSDMGGIPELITPGSDGLLFRSSDVVDLGAKMRQLIHPDTDLVAMGRKARKKVEQHFSSSIHYQKLMAIYEQASRVRKDHRSPGRERYRWIN